jgi:LPXTG-motif cell wall-anchored protein
MKNLARAALAFVMAVGLCIPAFAFAEEPVTEVLGAETALATTEVSASSEQTETILEEQAEPTVTETFESDEGLESLAETSDIWQSDADTQTLDVAFDTEHYLGAIYRITGVEYADGILIIYYVFSAEDAEESPYAAFWDGMLLKGQTDIYGDTGINSNHFIWSYDETAYGAEETAGNDSFESSIEFDSKYVYFGTQGTLESYLAMLPTDLSAWTTDDVVGLLTWRYCTYPKLTPLDVQRTGEDEVTVKVLSNQDIISGEGGGVSLDLYLNGTFVSFEGYNAIAGPNNTWTLKISEGTPISDYEPQQDHEYIFLGVQPFPGTFYPVPPWTPEQPIALTDPTTHIILSAPAGVLPEGAQLSVTPHLAAADAVNELTTKALSSRGVDRFVVYDIYVLDADGNRIPNDQIKDFVEIRIPLPEGFNAATTKAYHIAEDGTATEITSRHEDGFHIFSVDHFSYYALGDGGTEQETGTKLPATGDTTLAPLAIAGLLVCAGVALLSGVVLRGRRRAASSF